MATAKKLPSGSWRTRIYVGEENGKKIYKSFTAATKKESEYLATEYLMNNRKKNATEIHKSFVPEIVKDYIDVHANALSPSTTRGYTIIYNNQIQMLFHVRVEDFDATTHQKWIDDMTKQLSPKSVKNANGLLVAALRYYNVSVDPVRLPQKEYKPMTVPTTDEIKKIIEYFQKKGNQNMVIAVYLASAGTLRRGEVCALTADDVDRKNNTITICKAIAIDKDQNHVVKTPKNYSSNRTIELPRFIIEMLPKNGKIVTANVNHITRMFARAVKNLGMPHYTFHSLRHYSASIMHAQNIPTQYIMERGGWKTDQTLNRIYRNSLDDYKKKFTDQTNDYFSENLK